MKNETTLRRGMEPWELKVTYFNFIKVLTSFYMQRVLVASQHAQATFILKCFIIIGEGLFKLCIILGVFPLSLFNMLLAIGGRIQLLDFFSFCLRFALFGVFLVCQDLGPSILYLFLRLCWVLCFIDNWQVFIILDFFFHDVIVILNM